MGAGGFIGGHLIRKFNSLGDKYSVTAVGNNINNIVGIDSIKRIPGKITPELLCNIESPEIIYFLLGGSSVASSLKDPEHDLIKTVDPLLTVLKMMRESERKIKLVFISSAAVYGRGAGEQTSVKTELDPMSPYGFNKKMGEDIISFYSQAYGLNTKIIRPFSVYGPGLKKQLIWDVLEKISRKEVNFFGTGEEKRDWIYIDDLVDHLMLYADDAEDEEFIINSGTGKALSIKNIIELIIKLSGLSLTPRFMSTAKAGDPIHLVSDINEQKKYNFLYNTSLEEGLREVINWHANRGIEND